MPEASAVVVFVLAPVNATVAPAPAAAGLTVPEMFHTGVGARLRAKVPDVPPELAVKVAV